MNVPQIKINNTGGSNMMFVKVNKPNRMFVKIETVPKGRTFGHFWSFIDLLRESGLFRSLRSGNVSDEIGNKPGFMVSFLPECTDTAEILSAKTHRFSRLLLRYLRQRSESYPNEANALSVSVRFGDGRMKKICDLSAKSGIDFLPEE